MVRINKSTILKYCSSRERHVIRSRHHLACPSIVLDNCLTSRKQPNKSSSTSLSLVLIFFMLAHNLPSGPITFETRECAFANILSESRLMGLPRDSLISSIYSSTSGLFKALTSGTGFVSRIVSFSQILFHALRESKVTWRHVLCIKAFAIRLVL